MTFPVSIATFLGELVSIRAPQISTFCTCDLSVPMETTLQNYSNNTPGYFLGHLKNTSMIVLTRSLEYGQQTRNNGLVL